MNARDLEETNSSNERRNIRTSTRMNQKAHDSTYVRAGKRTNEHTNKPTSAEENGQAHKRTNERTNSPLSQGGHIAPGDQKSFALPR